MVYPSVEEWLISIGYEDYLEDFENAGYDNLEYMILQIGYSNFRLNELFFHSDISIGIDFENYCLWIYHASLCIFEIGLEYSRFSSRHWRVIIIDL